MKYLCSISLSIYLGIANLFAANEFTDTFIVTIYDSKVKVTAPRKLSDRISVIIDNKTLSKIIGKVEIYKSAKLEEKVFTSFVTLEQRQKKSVSITNGKNRKIFYIPLAPAFQKVELLTGKRSYEIPPKT